MEIDDEPKRYIKQFHVAEQFRFVNWHHFLGSLCFDQNALFNENVKPQRLLPLKSFIANGHDLLIGRLQST